MQGVAITPSLQLLPLSKNIYIFNYENHKFYEALKRLDIKLSGGSHNIHAADIFDHQSRYIKYFHWKSSSILDNDDLQNCP